MDKRTCSSLYLNPALTAVIIYLLVCCRNKSDRLFNWETKTDEKLIYLQLSYKVLQCMIRDVGEALKLFA